MTTNLTFCPNQSRPELFPNPELYTLELFHRCGSLILSRSFHVDRPEADIQEDWKKISEEEPQENSDSQSEDDDEEDPSTVGLVPFAGKSMLNSPQMCKTYGLGQIF